MPDFAKGDTVRLKSGGPLMTVQDLGDFGPTGPTNGAFCVWFVGHRKQEDCFDVSSLQKDSDDHGDGIAVATFNRG